MNTIAKWAMALGAVLAGAAYAQDPSTNDTSDGSGNTGMGTGALIHDTAIDGAGNLNTAAGYKALYSNTTGALNAALGATALQSNTTGDANTACGEEALYENTSGNNNTASGYAALSLNTTGNASTATGVGALYSNTTGNNNTATGVNALGDNTSASENTATGANTLIGNSTGNDNTATGFNALYSNTTGSYNTASGVEALNRNSTGAFNVASGYRAIYLNTSGSNNTASGTSALRNNSTGSDNIALGNSAGFYVTTGSNNIEIGNQGTSSDNNVIKIGTEGTQAKAFVAGIYNTSVKGQTVMVDSSGQLGVVVSSERFKASIESMGENTAKMGQLRPVTFKLKTDPEGAIQYGLIAEEVAKVYPELVIRDSQGRIDGVRYDELAPMLLNEMQKQSVKIAEEHTTVATLVTQHEADATKIAALEQKVADVDDLKQQLSAVIQELKARDNMVAQR